MRCADSPTAAAASICARQARQELWRPDPAVEMAGFGSGSALEPRVEMAGFDRSNRRYLPTVSRLTPNSRAIRRRDQPPAASVEIECCRLTLRMFIASICGYAASDATITSSGWFSFDPYWLVLSDR